MDTDSEQFDCDCCPIVDRLDGLWPENAEAWRIFRRLATRFVVDTGIGGAVFRAVTAGWSDDAITDLLERLSLIYDVTMPPPAPPKAD